MSTGLQPGPSVLVGSQRPGCRIMIPVLHDTGPDEMLPINARLCAFLVPEATATAYFAPHMRCGCAPPRRAGQEVTHTYSMDLERNDMSLINHFFVQDLQPPRLCALDLPGGHLNGGLFGPDSSFLPRFPDELEVGAWRFSIQPCLPLHCWHAAQGVMTVLGHPGPIVLSAVHNKRGSHARTRCLNAYIAIRMRATCCQEVLPCCAACRRSPAVLQPRRRRSERCILGLS